MATESIHWALFDLVGRVKAGRLAIDRGLSLGQAGREAFALLYQRKVAANLIVSGFGDEKYRKTCGYLVSGLNFAVKTVLGMIESEQERQLVLELFGTADKT